MDGAVSEYGGSGPSHLSFEKDGSSVSVDLGVTVEDRARLGADEAGNALVTAMKGSVDLLAGAKDRRLAAWGREGALTPWERSAPTLGRCPPGVAARGGCVERTRRRGVTEWWGVVEGGVEQGWTVDAPPSGEGPLAFLVETDGGSARARGACAELTDAHGRAWSVRAPVAWDARGKPLVARCRVAGRVLRFEVDDAGATWPVTVDPVYEAESWSAVGESGEVGFAGAIAGAGDVDGDGLDDLIVGAAAYQDGRGAAFVYLGTLGGMSTGAAATLLGEQARSYFGGGVGGAGDVDGDGYDDVIVGASGWDGTSEDLGRADVWLGSASGLGAGPTLLGEDRYDGFGYSVGTAGDVNGDGYADVFSSALGAGEDYESNGQVYVYMGGAAGIEPVAAFVAYDADADMLGLVVSAAGDVNSDGFDDLLVGVPYDGGMKSGSVFVYEGSADGLPETRATRISREPFVYGWSLAGVGDLDGDGYDDIAYGSRDEGVSVHLGSDAGISSRRDVSYPINWDDAFGFEVAGAGDLDGDGYDELLVSAPEAGASSGRVYLYRGSADGPSESADATLGEGLPDAERFGKSLAGLGDVDGDGLPDFGVGADDTTGFADGRAYVYTGRADGLPSAPATTLLGPTSHYLGAAVAGAGDLDGDGYDDVAVGAPGADGRFGRVYVHAGSSEGLPAEATVTLAGDGSSTDFGSAVAGVGDVDADGYDDLVVAAAGGQGAPARMYLYRGSVAGLATAPAAWSPGDDPGEHVDGAGDVNGDGFDDVVVAAPAYTPYGLVALYAGGPDGPGDTPDVALVGESAADSLGEAVAGAGDIDGDGFADVVVGSGATSRVLLYPGGASGLQSDPSAVRFGAAPGDRFGAAVDGAGDVDGDGYADVLVGASYPGGAGRVYVYAGSAAGLVATAATALELPAYPGFGTGVAGAGDVDDDGFADVIVSALGHWEDPGSVHVYLGAAAGLADEPVLTLSGAYPLDLFGAAVAGAGDVDGDGSDDVLVGWPDYADNAGRVELHRGYVDRDGDGVPRDLDCDDADPGIGAPSAYLDADGDGYGDPSVSACEGTPGYVPDATDCDDGAAAVHPGAPETDCSDPTDYDCDGLARDGDGDADGHGACSDCDDDDASTFPGADERCDREDDDCDGAVDEDAIDVTTWQADADGDGYTDAATSVTACDAPAGLAEASEPPDCDDRDPAVFPGAPDPPGDGRDQDCDGADLPGADLPEVGGGCGCTAAGSPGASFLPLVLVLLAIHAAATPKLGRWRFTRAG